MMKQKNVKVLMILPMLLVLTAAFITWQVTAVYGSDPLPVDMAIQKWFLGIRTEFLNTAVSLLTHTTDTITIVILCALLLISPFPGRLKFGVPVTLCALADMGVYKLMKHAFLRPRPDVMYHIVEQGGYSFPSGHSATSMAVYGLLFYLIRRYCKNPLAKNILSGLCLFLAVTVGPSRLYVGVHWFTDVMTGWCIGGTAMLLTILVLEKVRKENESI